LSLIFYTKYNINLKIKVSPEKGNGVFATEQIPVNSFIIEYKGELLKFNEGIEREKTYTGTDDERSFMFLFTWRSKQMW